MIQLGTLYFYSDQVEDNTGNQMLDKKLFENMDNSNIKIGYIPSTEDENKTFFQKKVRDYSKYGVNHIIFFDLYEEFSMEGIDELLSCDIIHLSAGNPIEFGEAIKNRNLKKVLCTYYEKGGIIVGVSGGAVQLGKSTKLFQLFVENYTDESETLELVDFEFLPHYNRWEDSYKEKVVEYAKKTNTTVYAANTFTLALSL